MTEAVGVTGGVAETHVPPVFWEYKSEIIAIHQLSSMAYFNTLGVERWEMVSALPSDHIGQCVCLFKRVRYNAVP